MDSASSTLRLIADYYGHFNSGQWDAQCALLTHDVVHDINQGGREVGQVAFRAFLQRMATCYHEQLSDIRLCASADGTHAAAEYVVEGRYLVTDAGLPPAHGQSYRLPGGAFFAIRDGRIARVTNAYNLQDWLRQISGPAAAVGGNNG